MLIHVAILRYFGHAADSLLNELDRIEVCVPPVMSSMCCFEAQWLRMSRYCDCLARALARARYQVDASVSLDEWRHFFELYMGFGADGRSAADAVVRTLEQTVVSSKSMRKLEQELEAVRRRNSTDSDPSVRAAAAAEATTSAAGNNTNVVSDADADAGDNTDDDASVDDAAAAADAATESVAAAANTPAAAT